MKKILLISAIITTMLACESERGCMGEVFESRVCLVFIDKDSTDLLNPDNPNGYKFSEMGLYKDRELELKLFYYILFEPPIDYKEKKNGKTVGCATSYLKLNEATIDTVYTEVILTECSRTLGKVVYNGEDITRTGLVIKE